jgi:carboxymethylenebutenolidase
MGEHLTLTASDGFELGAYRAAPAGTARGGVVVIQEIFGVNEHIRAVVDRYAAQGYLAIAPALFDRVERGVELGYDADGMTRGIELARVKTDPVTVMADLRAAAAAVASAGKVGVVGYCWGGLLTARCAIECGDVFAAASSYYGGGTPSLQDRTPVVPMVMHYGELDHALPLEDVRALAAAWPHVTVHVYDGAQHGFNCDQRASWDAASAALAEERTLAFFAERLGA